MFSKSSKRPSVMKHNFSQIPHADIQRSTFNRSHGYKTTLKEGGILYPIFVDEALPGDTFKVNLTAIARLATPIVPVMDNIFIDYFFFAVPNRLVWNNWQRFMGEQDDPTDSIDYTVPITTAASFTAESIQDYFGLPIGVSIEANALPLRCYSLIWNSWFRDENLQDSVYCPLDDGPDTAASFELLRRGKRHDYFTSCLPWPNKTGTEVEVPLGEHAPVVGIGKGTQIWGTTGSAVYETGGSSSVVYAGYSTINNAQPDNAYLIEEDPDNSGYPGIYADLSSATAATINSLREAFQLQKMLERDARGGTRYTEILKSHFRVTSPDARLQRPEYLGGGSRPVNISAVPQTSETDANTPQGNLAAIGYHAAGGVGFTKSFVEHSYIIGLASVRADLTYQQTLNKLWQRQTKYDFYWPALSNLGEQEVLNSEIWAQGTAADDNVFGYQERWAEYRYKPSQITGQLRSDYATSLDVWHLSQDFATLPLLNSDFIEDDPPIDRCLAVPAEPYFVFDGYFNCITTRPMPMYSVPGLIDHF